MNITQTPSAYAPSLNPIIFGFSTELLHLLYFNVIIKKAVTNEIISKNKIFVAPNQLSASFDISRILDNLVNTPVVNSDEFLINLDGTLKYYITVQGMDAYGNTVGEAVTSDVFTCYNGRVNQYQAIDGIDTYFQSNTINSFLTDLGTEQKLHHTVDASLYFLANNNSHLAYFLYSTTLSDGTVRTKQVQFSNPSNQDLHRILVSPSLLAAEYDILTSNIKNIKVVGYNSSNEPMTEEVIYFITAFRCGIDIVNLYWENSKGGYDYHSFTQPKKDISVEKQNIQTNDILYKTNGVYSPSKRTINVNKTVNYTVVSAPLTDKEYDIISDIIASKNVYAETTGRDLIPVQLTNSSVQILQKRYTKQHNRLTLSFAVSDNIDIQTYTDTNTTGFDYVFDIVF